jgi:hypothetical protein
MITKEDILTELKMASIDNANFIDGKLSWDYVSADTYMALKPTTDEECRLIDNTLDQFANYYETA